MFEMEKTQELYDHLNSLLEEKFDGRVGLLRTYFGKFLFFDHPLNPTKEEMNNLKEDLLKGFWKIKDQMPEASSQMSKVSHQMPEASHRMPEASSQTAPAIESSDASHEPKANVEKPEARDQRDLENSEDQMVEMGDEYNWNMERSVADYDGIVRKLGADGLFSDALARASVYVDAGCAKGVAAKFASLIYPDIKVYGIDITDRLDVDVSENYKFIKGDITNIELPEKADLITSLFVLQYIKDPLKAFEKSL